MAAHSQRQARDASARGRASKPHPLSRADEGGACMSTLESRVADALLDPNPRESESRVKATVADALGDFDPSAKLTVTTYFNHTYAPDMVMSWGSVERPV